MPAPSAIAPLALAALLALGACSEYPGHALTPQEMNPLRVSQTGMTLALDMPQDARELRPDEAQRFDRFIDEYLGQGSGSLEFIASEREPATGRLKLLTERAMRRGVSGREIKVRQASLGAGQPQPLVVSYRRYLVELPKCGNWDYTTFNPSNTSMPNFGCAVQRNIGTMVANPADLQEPAPLGTVSATRTDRAIRLYNEGKKTESEDSRSNTVSSSAIR